MFWAGVAILTHARERAFYFRIGPMASSGQWILTSPGFRDPTTMKIAAAFERFTR